MCMGCGLIWMQLITLHIKEQPTVCKWPGRSTVRLYLHCGAAMHVRFPLYISAKELSSRSFSLACPKVSLNDRSCHRQATCTPYWVRRSLPSTFVVLTCLECDQTCEELPLVPDHHDIADEGHLLLDLVLYVHRRDVLPTRGDDQLCSQWFIIDEATLQ